jgi:hypothetical protein
MSIQDEQIGARVLVCMVLAAAILAIMLTLFGCQYPMR